MPTPSPPNTGAFGARHALIIEDDLVTGLDLQALLQPLGFSSFAFASTTQQAVEQACIHKPDLATVDLGLLDGDGMEAADALERACGRIATLFITGDPDAVQACKPDRAVLGKPVSAFSLQRALESMDRNAEL